MLCTLFMAAEFNVMFVFGIIPVHILKYDPMKNNNIAQLLCSCTIMHVPINSVIYYIAFNDNHM